MLKIARSQTREHKKLAALFLAHCDEGASFATLELLLKQSFQRWPLIPGHLSCQKRQVRFHLDRRAALLDWLISYPEGMRAGRYYVSVIEWGNGFLYAYLPAPGAMEVSRLEDMLSDLSWYHTSRCVLDPDRFGSVTKNHAAERCS